MEALLKSDRKEIGLIADLLESIQSGDYMVLRSKICSDFWKKLQVQSIKRGRVEQALNERKSKRIKNKNEISPEEKLDGLQSVGTTIKNKAHRIYLNHKYSELDDNEKSMVSDGFNSILDITDKRKSGNHKALYTMKQWAMLQEKWLKNIVWKELDRNVVCDLKEMKRWPRWIKGLRTLFTKAS